MATSTDHPAASGGAQSVRLIPSGISGTLYRQLSTDYNELYMRYYVKYLGNMSHHAGAYIGGYYPPSAWPQGDAGLKGVRPNGDLLWISAFEQQGNGGNAGAPNTHIGTYNQWIDMQGAAWQGNYYGRDLLVTENPPINAGAWQCVEMRVKMNSTVDSRDGELQLWVNDALVQSFTPAALRSGPTMPTAIGSRGPGADFPDSSGAAPWLMARTGSSFRILVIRARSTTSCSTIWSSRRRGSAASIPARRTGALCRRPSPRYLSCNERRVYYEGNGQ